MDIKGDLALDQVESQHSQSDQLLIQAAAEVNAAEAAINAINSYRSCDRRLAEIRQRLMNHQ